MSARAAAARGRRAVLRISRLSAREIMTTVHSLCVMSVVELTVRWVSLPRLSRTMGVPLRLGPEHGEGEQMVLHELDARARRQLECTARVARIWPFSDGPCLRRSLTGGHLVRRLRPELRLGITGTGEAVGAHAWLEIDGRPLEPVEHLRPFSQVPDRGVR